MASVLSHSKRHDALKHFQMDPMGLGRAYPIQTLLYIPTWYFGTLRTCEHSAIHLPSFLANIKFSKQGVIVLNGDFAQGTIIYAHV
jgi:hypothetical protein